MAPHDEDDDLDDLDDILSKFTPNAGPATNNAPQTQVPAQSKPHASLQDSSTSKELADDAFAQELAQGMEALMKELSGSGTTSGEEPAEQKAMREAWEAMFRDEGDKSTPFPPMNGPSSTARASGESAFQKSIRETMERMKSSEQSMKESTSSSAAPEGDELASILAALGSGEGGEEDTELASFLESMMDQLMSKEILYEPLKELHDKFPDYLASHLPEGHSREETKSADSSARPLKPISVDDHTRYLSQQRLISKIISKFDDPKYDDEAKTPEADAARKEIINLMSELQSLGSPPEELMGPLPAGLGLGGEGMPEGCSIT
jgi:peroxin-19